MRRKDRDDDVDDNVHDNYAHFFQQETTSLYCLDDGNDVSAEDDAVIRSIAGRGGSGRIRREGGMDTSGCSRAAFYIDHPHPLRRMLAI
mmetsp:Transcript_10224/g.20578  ORF Transcript_10224/g.20578 Transcript_10224/m.20578 type:complete len:89 (-) Transcript_10224:109-375(-)